MSSYKVALSGRESEQLDHTLKIISLTETSAVVGSAKYLAHKYPGDFDVFEYALSKSNKYEAAAEFSVLISTVGKMISIDETIQMTDFKAGSDSRFSFKEPKNGGYERSMQDFIKKCEREKLITSHEANDLLSSSYDDAKEFFRKLESPHWELSEVINAVKHLRGGKILTLEEAVATNSRVKMDTVSWFMSRLQAVEIVYVMAYTDERGHAQNFFDLGDYVEGLKHDINVYKFTNPLKTMKRLWSLSVFLDCDELIEDLAPVFSSDAAALNQLLADIETLKLIREPLDKMVLVVLEFRRKLQNHLTPQEYHLEALTEMKEKGDKIYKMWISHKVLNNFNYKEFHEYLDWLESFLKPLINKKALPFFEKIKASKRYCGQTNLLNL
jgi:hypothetical protein